MVISPGSAAAAISVAHTTATPAIETAKYMATLVKFLKRMVFCITTFLQNAHSRPPFEQSP
jgi:hypothetical protein